MCWLSYTGWQTEKPENLHEEGLGDAPKTQSREALLQQLRYLGVWSRGEASFPLVISAHLAE